MSLDVSLIALRPVEVFDYNITHNLAAMAIAAGIYKHLWRPDELGITRAVYLIEPLEAGLATIIASRESLEKLNPENGWGDYNNLLQFVANYLEACKGNPDAEIRVSR